MKKLIMFVMVLMLCLGTDAKAELVAGYGFPGSLDSYPNPDHPGVIVGTEAYSSDVPPSGSGISSLQLDGESWVEIPTLDTCIFDGSSDFSVVYWFKTTEDNGVILSASSEDGGTDTEFNLAWLLFPGDTGAAEPACGFDNFWNDGIYTETEGLGDGAWHHLAHVYEAAEPAHTIYLDGVEDATADWGVEFICDNPGSTVVIGWVPNTSWQDDFSIENPWNGLLADIGIYDHALDEAGVQEAMDSGYGGVPNPLIIDANDTTIYEPTVLPPLDGEGNFTVCLRNQPGSGDEVTVIIDPNGPAGGQGNPDLTLDDNDGSPDYTVTLTFTDGNWDVSQVVSFVAVDDDIPEPDGEGFNDAQTILVSSYYPEHPEDANYVGERKVKVDVIDNDKANILFSYTPLEATSPEFAVTGPIELFEQGSSPTTQWRNIGISLQTPPTGDDPVKLQVVVEGDDNLPLTDPNLPFEEIDDPNGLFFTADNYDTPQIIKIWGNDDAELQVLGEEGGGYPSYEGAQDYQAALVVTVVDGGGDDGYQWEVPILDEFEEPTGEYETVSMEREIDFDIEDNECGAFGILDTDVGNPYYLMDEETLGGDPNDWIDDDGNPLPDCYVDIYDAIEMVTRWLVCSDPQGTGCEQYND